MGTWPLVISIYFGIIRGVLQQLNTAELSLPTNNHLFMRTDFKVEEAHAKLDVDNLVRFNKFVVSIEHGLS